MLPGLPRLRAGGHRTRRLGSYPSCAAQPPTACEGEGFVTESLRVGSLFSGAGGFDLGLERAGMEVVWQAEVEKHACSVLRKRYGVPNLGDVRGIDGARAGTVDVLVGGFPCQDVSVAGKRAGLAGKRTGLFWEFARLATEIRPQWIIAENVVGLLSSNGGRDFGSVLGALADLGYWWAYRVFDARFFGVAQRRRRVFIVGRLGARGAAEVLLEPEGLRRDPAKSRKAREEVAGSLGGGAGARGWCPDTDRATFVPAVSGETPAHGVRRDGESETFVAHSLRAEGFDASEDGSARGTPLVVRTASTGGNGIGVGGVAYALDSVAGSGQAVAWNAAQITSRLNRTRVEPGLPCPTLDGSARAHVGVRRLTPLECERLMGWPDGWTAVGVSDRGAEYALADGPRYRLCGNGVVGSVAEWIGRRLLAVEALGIA